MVSIRQWLSQPQRPSNRLTRYLVFHVRIWLHCFRLLGVNQCMTQAAALAYNTIFGLVPLMIVTLMVFQMFPASQELSDRIRKYAYEQLNLTLEYPASETGTASAQSQTPAPAEQKEEQQAALEGAAAKIEEITKNYVTKASSGTITIVGVLLVAWAAVALMSTIEQTFNRIYHVSTGRRFLNRLFNYWGLLTLGAIFLAAVLYVHTQSMLASGLYKSFMESIQPYIPFLTSFLAIFCLYLFLPNTHVSPKAAAWGAFVATVIWTAAKILFGWYVKKFMPQFAVYGVLGLIPLTVFWIFISWLIVLFGLQLTYATQNIRRLDAAEFARVRHQDKCFLANDQTVIRVMEYVLNAFERKDQKPVSVESVAYKLDMPVDFTDKILTHLVRTGLLVHTSEPTVGYVPSTDGSHISLDEISKAIGGISFAQKARVGGRLGQVFEELEQLLSRYSLKEVLNTEEEFTAETPPSVERPEQNAENQP
ncbi:MAG: YihY family inner membrane protein [Planctomycetaceae bacterium]|nr:YihY family inner membrane protein [Planctomycetaceae bacterium]